jgi:hypothetical protein
MVAATNKFFILLSFSVFGPGQFDRAGYMVDRTLAVPFDAREDTARGGHGR